MIELKSIARQLKITPKAARSKLRRSKDTPKTQDDRRWVFNANDAKKVKKILAA